MEKNTQNEMPNYAETFKTFEEGDIIKGTVLRIDPDEVLVDVGYKSEGVISQKELTFKGDCKPSDLLKVGQEIEAMVVQKEDNEGRLILSKKRADFEKAWIEVERVKEENGIIKGKVIEVVKGGLILDVGLRAFLPASLIELSRVTDLGSYLGKELECKIIDMNKLRKSVVLSRKALLEEQSKTSKKNLLSKIEKGQVVRGRVTNITDFGAFVDIGGITGLVHLSELSWKKINHPSEVVAIGDQVKVQVLQIDEEKGRVSLGLKQTQEDPWRKAVKKLSVGSIVKAKVTHLVPYGAFVEVEKGIEGLIHISELSSDLIEDPQLIVRKGQIVQVKVIDIDEERRRVSFSLKKARAEVRVREEKQEKLTLTKEEKIKTEKVQDKMEEKVKEGVKAQAKRIKEEKKKLEKIKEELVEAKEEIKEPTLLDKLEEQEEEFQEPVSLEQVLEEMKKSRKLEKK